MKYRACIINTSKKGIALSFKKATYFQQLGGKEGGEGRKGREGREGGEGWEEGGGGGREGREGRERGRKRPIYMRFTSTVTFTI